MRRLIRRLGNWLVTWADRGAKLHVCIGRPKDMSLNGVGYKSHEDRTWGLSAEPQQRTVFMALYPGEHCPYCEEPYR